MRRGRLLSALAAAAAAATTASPPAAAQCLAAASPSRDPAVRYAGTNVRRVTGTYRIERIVDRRNAASPDLVYARLTTRRGTGFAVIQPYWQVLAQCLGYDLPTGDAEGLFYLSRRQNREGRYTMLGWSGHLVPGKAIALSGEEGQQ